MLNGFPAPDLHDAAPIVAHGGGDADASAPSEPPLCRCAQLWSIALPLPPGVSCPGAHWAFTPTLRTSAAGGVRNSATRQRTSRSMACGACGAFGPSEHSEHLDADAHRSIGVAVV